MPSSGSVEAPSDESSEVNARPASDSRVPRAGLWLLGILLLAFVLRAQGLERPFSPNGYRGVMASWGTAAFARNFDQHGFLDAKLMNYRWRVELDRRDVPDDQVGLLVDELEQPRGRVADGAHGDLGDGGSAAEELRVGRELEHLERRWSASPKVYYTLLLVVLAIMLAIAVFS